MMNDKLSKIKENIPSLRFPGFDDSWVVKSLKEMSNNVSYGMNSSAVKYDGINKYIRITDIDAESRRFIPNPITSPDGLLEEKFKLKKNDIVFARTGASVGKSYLYHENDGKLYFAGFLIKFSLISCDAYFIYSYTFKSDYWNWVKGMSMRSGQPGINAEEFKSIKIPTPSLPEQQKIAAFLSAVDQKIEKLSRKKDLLQSYKKGVMQKIFSQEIRFKSDDGNDFPDWEEKRLGEVVGGIKSGKTKPSQTGDFPVFGSTGKIGYCDTVTHHGEFILIARVGANAGLINFVNDKFSVTDNTLVVESSKNVVTKFVFYLLEYFNINRLVFGTGQPLITGGQLKSLKVLIAVLNEQQKIANFLSNIDKKIEAVNQQLSHTQAFKKGLLQRMFV